MAVAQHNHDSPAQGGIIPVRSLNGAGASLVVADLNLLAALAAAGLTNADLQKIIGISAAGVVSNDLDLLAALAAAGLTNNDLQKLIGVHVAGVVANDIKALAGIAAAGVVSNDLDLLAGLAAAGVTNGRLGGMISNPGRVAIAVLRGSADVVEADTVTIGADVYEFEVVNTDSNDNTSGGDFNNTTNPLTVTLDVGAYANLNGALAVGDLVRIENEIMRVAAVDGDDVEFQRGVSGTSAAAHADASDIFIGDGIAGSSTVAVGVVTTLTPTAWTNALIADINGGGSENALAVDISNNEVLLAAADAPGGTPQVGNVTLALAETFTNANNEWDTAAMRGGAAAGVQRLSAQTRECNATEDALGTMHFVFDFAPSVVDVHVYDDTLDQAGGAVAVAWDGTVTVSGTRVTLADGGGAAPIVAGNLARVTVIG